VAALIEEDTYLQRRIRWVLGEEISISALLWANADERDFAALAVSDWPGRLVVPDAAEVSLARRLIKRLKEIRP
jgi:hypothetical protein